MALGARRGNVLRQLLGEGLRLAGLGIAAGVIASLGVMRLLAGLLFGVSPSDTPVLAGVATVILAVSAAACTLPAWRAATIDPMVALRHE